MPRFEICDATTVRLFERVIKQHHPELNDAGVTITYLFAHSDSEDDPRPLKLGGYPCAAISRKNSTRDRVAGKSDCEVHIDFAEWDELTAEQREALADHELTHFQPLRDKKRADLWRFDYAKRPVVMMRLHDYQLGGFKAVAERHGEESPEVRSMRSTFDRFGQMLFPFAAPVTAFNK
jgi:hypothetical protein